MPISVILMHLGTEPHVSENNLLLQLTDQEQWRAHSLSVSWLRRNFILSHAALHRIVRDRFTGDRPNRFCVTSTGKPSFDTGPHVSLSRGARWAALGFSCEQALGIDLAVKEPRIGRDQAHRYAGLASRLQSRRASSQLNFLLAWTEVEAIAELGQIPMEHLLEHPQADLPFLTTFVDTDLVVTIACETDQDIRIEWASWSLDGTLITFPAELRQLSMSD